LSQLLSSSLILVLLLAACSTRTVTPIPTVSAPTDFPTPNLPRLPTAEKISLRLVPNQLRPGLRVTLLAMGFADKEPIEFFFTRPDGSETASETAVSDLNGNAAYSFDVPNDWPPGEWIANVVSQIDPTRRARVKVQLKR